MADRNADGAAATVSDLQDAAAIETELVVEMHSAKTRAAFTAAIPMDRYGTPDETASAAVYLASEEADYITGQGLAVDGGFLSAGVMPRKAATDCN